MNQRFTLDRRSFEQFLAALSLVQQLKNQAAYQRGFNGATQPFFSLLQLQRAINSGSVDFRLVMANLVKLTQSVVGASAAGVWLFRNAEEFSCSAHIGTIHDPDGLAADILAYLATSPDPNSNSCAFSPTLRKASHYPGSPNSVAVAALRVNTKVVGALAAFSSDFDAFASRDLENLHFLAGLLEQALQKAMQAGCREAVALEQAALLQLLQKIGPQANESERQAPESEQACVSEHAPNPFAPDERRLYSRLQEAASSKAHSSEPETTSAAYVGEASRADISLPGVGVRAALGDVREFTGEETPFFLWQAVRHGSVRVRALGAQSRLEALRILTIATVGMRNGMAYLLAIPQRLLQRGASISRSAARFRPVATLRPDRLTQIRQWHLKVRFSGARRLRSSEVLPVRRWLRPVLSCCQLLLQSFSSASRGLLNFGRDRLIYLLRLSTVQARSMRRNLRQTRANLSAGVAQQTIRVRMAQRRQKTILTNSAGRTGDALQHARESLADVASSAGQSTITAISTVRARIVSLRGTRLNPRALRRSAGAIGVLSIMAIFLGLQAGVRHSLEHVNAASASADAAVATVAPAAARVTIQRASAPSSHLTITDASVADTLHDLTRYEIITLQRAAEYGDDEAAFQLGMAYETGYYVRQNCSTAAHWVKVSAESGNAAAAYNLGLRYRTGDGLPGDESAATHWLRMASTRSYSPAKFALAAVR